MHPCLTHSRLYYGVPETIAIVGTAVAAASTAASAVAANNTAQFNADVATNNAKAANDQATYENQLKQIQLEKTLGAEQAQMGLAGVTGGSGEDLQYNTLVMGKFDQLATTYQGQLRGNQQNSQAMLDQMGGQSALTSGMLSAAGGAMSGAAKAGSFGDSESGVGAEPELEYDGGNNNAYWSGIGNS